ncbi:formate hydrogenlyase maturation HycH family protein [Pectobacterium peruviense]|uniref:Formate hydrogenlyase maturation protein HycH n=1 Tax=Pectobacterium peruviense TaxID=2066479 RepID=A0ABX4S875_9GAMM|nr:formate hydrogenlyase maturation HycH family protein [Pectobacterium peruviense]KML68581.1 formate hydrogenlyase maturation protein HycH [Pectobacterium peruviense]PKX81053.1 formate hydrogenlyase maturation protein HycH [Pectobacterium peruviense]PKX86752.1 formate hydrogenlyase maturation protein HycH [Pectobacterium peruviense]
MSEDQVIFWSLRQKFLDSESVPEQPQQVMYYSLAIGHHVGVIDCLKAELTCDLDRYPQWTAMLGTGDAQRKMNGLLTFGEIYIDSTHVDMLAHALAPLAQTRQLEPFKTWSTTLLRLLAEIQQEPAIYLIVKKQIANKVG